MLCSVVFGESKRFGCTVMSHGQQLLGKYSIERSIACLYLMFLIDFIQ